MKQFDKRLNKKIFIVNIIVLIFMLSFFLVFILTLSNKIATPYNQKENFYWIYKNIFGLSHRNSQKVKNIESEYVFDSAINPEYEIAFVGDLNPMNKKKFIFSDEVKAFIQKSDYFVGNFHGIITEMVSTPSIWNFNLRHERGVVDFFRKIMPPQKIMLSVANNHAFDFGKKGFIESSKLLKYAGVKIFGLNKKPYVDLNEGIRIVGATEWLNKKDRGVVPIKEGNKYIKEGAFNILYPHFGYEFELYPREKNILQSENLLNYFDAVVGHHSHCPQPVTIVIKNSVKKLAAYSLGTFLGEVYEKKYQYGLILKMFLGKDKDGEMKLSKIEYKLIKCNLLLDGSYLVDFSSEEVGAFNRKKGRKGYHAKR